MSRCEMHFCPQGRTKAFAKTELVCNARAIADVSWYLAGASLMSYLRLGFMRFILLPANVSGRGKSSAQSCCA